MCCLDPRHACVRVTVVLRVYVCMHVYVHTLCVYICVCELESECFSAPLIFSNYSFHSHTHTHSHSHTHSHTHSHSHSLTHSLTRRLGWSTGDSGLELGETPLSYGYGCTGKAVVNNQYKEYGEPYGDGDVITCLLVSLYRDTVSNLRENLIHIYIK